MICFSINLIFAFFFSFRSLAVGGRTGYRLYSLNGIETLEKIYSNGTEDSCLVERLFSSSLVAVVSLAAPRKLKVCHFKKGTEICNYSYSNTILAVKLNRLVGLNTSFCVIVIVILPFLFTSS